MSLDTKNGKTATATARSLSKKPVVSSLAPQSSLPRKPPSSLLPPQLNLSQTLTRRPGLMSAPSSASRRKPTTVIGPSLSLPKSPIQEKLRDEKEVKRKEQERVEQLRLAWLQKLHRAQSIASSVDEFLSWQQKEEERLKQRRLAWSQKLQHAQGLARRVESFGWADTASVDRYLWLRSLVDRAQELERQMVEVAKQDGVNAQTRDLSNVLWRRLEEDVFGDGSLAWIKQCLEETQSGRQRGISSREAKRRPLPSPAIRNLLLDYEYLQREMVSDGATIAKLTHELRQVRRIRLQMLLCPETFDYHRFIFPLVFVAEAAFRLINDVSNSWTELKSIVRLAYNESHSFRQKIENHQLIPHHIGHLQLLARVVIRDVRRRLPELSNSTLQRELFSTYRSLTTYISHFLEFTDELRSFVLRHPETTRIRGKTSFVPKLASIAQDIDILKESQKAILEYFELAWLWTGISRLSTSDGQYSSDYNASEDSLSNDSRALATVHAIVPPGLHSAVATAPWLTPTPLYPLGGAIPIHYITTVDDLLAVLHRLHDPQRIKVMGFDTVRATGAQVYRPVQFLVLATEDEIVIVHLGRMLSQQILLREPFRDLFRDPNILKVGVDVEQQRRLLLDELGIEAEGLLELHATEEDDVLLPIDSFNYDHGRKISSMSAKSLGFPLPALNLDLAENSLLGGTKQPYIGPSQSTDPLQYFTHLASRAHVVLRIYLATIADGSAVLPQRTQPSFGPLHVYKLSRDPAKSHQESKYVISMARFLASKTTFWMELRFKELHRSKRIQQENRLTSYFLFTTLHKSLETIADYMGTPKVAAEILAIAHDAKLPLREDDAAQLELLCRWHGPVSSLETTSGSPAASPEIATSLGQEAGPVSMTERYAMWSPVRSRSAKHKRASIARIDVTSQPAGFVDLSASSDVEAQSGRRKELSPHEDLVRQLESELRSVRRGSGLSKGKRRSEIARLNQRIKRAMSGSRSLPLASPLTNTEQALSSNISGGRPIQGGTLNRHENPPQTIGPKELALASDVDQREWRSLNYTIATLSSKIQTIIEHKDWTRQQRTSLNTWSVSRRRARRQQREVEARIRRNLGAGDAGGIVETQAQEVRAQMKPETVGQAVTTADALKQVLDVDSMNAERESIVDDVLNVEQHVEEELKTPGEAKSAGGEDSWWGGEL
ncbi:hypothetical protein H2200_012095 [Cladophialophora chaetospira]|uniref:Uncharacterized protein n=1 Tax=Cladophialophora chaetospira TaxID=386627 RepID=A0AA38WY89_9EURO|nr:hypothetical protein H2200_012095 [Cladophialophora chaetospira]